MPGVLLLGVNANCLARRAMLGFPHLTMRTPWAPRSITDALLGVKCLIKKPWLCGNRRFRGSLAAAAGRSPTSTANRQIVSH